MLHNAKIHKCKVTLVDGTVHEINATFHDATNFRENLVKSLISYTQDIDREHIEKVEIDEGVRLQDIKKEMKLEGVQLDEYTNEYKG